MRTFQIRSKWRFISIRLLNFRALKERSILSVRYVIRYQGLCTAFLQIDSTHPFQFHPWFPPLTSIPFGCLMTLNAFEFDGLGCFWELTQSTFRIFEWALLTGTNWSSWRRGVGLAKLKLWGWERGAGMFPLLITDVGCAIPCCHGDVTFAECYSLVRFH